jgi:hypothetical protein
MAAEVGVKVESTGLACCGGWDGGALRAEEAKEEEEPDRQDVDIVVSTVLFCSERRTHRRSARVGV